ncbi:MAG: hypothetical protein ACR2NZ_24700 [Rubripirellula sp.]
MRIAFPNRRQMLGPWMAAGFAMLLCSTGLAQDAKTAALTVGTEAPDITLTGIDGKQFKLSDVTGSGKNVALMFDRAHW